MGRSSHLGSQYHLAEQLPVIRHNSVVDGQDLPAEFYVPSSTRICPESDLSEIPRVTVAATEFSEDVAHTNIDLVKGYKALQNEF